MGKIKKHLKAKTHTDQPVSNSTVSLDKCVNTGIFAKLKLDFIFHPLCIRLLLCLALSLFHLLTFSLSVAALPQFWTQEMQFSLGKAESTQPDVCAYGEEIFVVWADNRIDGNYELFFRYSSDGGLTWSIEERITETKADSIQPAIACEKSNVHLTWREKKKTPPFPEESTLFYSQWNGKSWSVPQPLSPTPQNNPRSPDIAITQTGIVYVVWEEDYQEGGTKAYFSSKDKDGVFHEPELITMGDWNTAEPSIAGGYRAAYVVWRDEREATAQIYTKQLGETLFDYDIRLSSGGNCRHPSISVLEPRIYVAYESRPTEFFPADIFVSESNDSGQSFELAHQITSSTAESIRPVISAASDIVWLFWQDGESGSWKIHFSYSEPAARSTKKDQTWTSSAKFRDSATPHLLPAITRSDGYQNPQFYLFWVAGLDVSKIFYSWRDTIPPKTPTKPLHIDEDAKVGYDNDDVLTFSWTIPESQGRNDHFTDLNSFQRARLPALLRAHHSEVAGYNIYVSTNNGEFEKVDSTDRTIYDLAAPDSSSGKYCQIRVEAFDSVGNTSELSSVSEIVHVDNVSPYVQLDFPRSNSVLVRSIPIIASCYDENLITCRLKYGVTNAPTAWKDLGESIRTNIDREKILVWDNSELQGVYTLNLVAEDLAGNHSSYKIPVIVDNLMPLSISPGERTKLPNLDPESAYRAPSFSPNAEAICFSSNERGTEDIYVYSLSSHQRFRVTQDKHIDFFPAWSPDSNWIAFQSLDELGITSPQSTGWDIWIVRSDGSERHPLLQLQSNETSPVFSPSGNQMAFVSDLDGDKEIFILTNLMEVMEGTEPEIFQLTHNDYADTSPTWAPDETRLCFSADRFGNWDLFEIDIDGSREKRLTNELADETSPKYSPDGKRVLYLSNSSGTYHRVVAQSLVAEVSGIMANSATTSYEKPVRLTMPGEDVLYADWAPDLKSIVYQNDQIWFRRIDSPIEEQEEALPLQALITRPYEGENLENAFFDIKGVARGANFEKYIMEYKPLGVDSQIHDTAQNQSWYTIGGYSTVQVSSENFLGRLDTSGLQGEYAIKLTVIGENSVKTDEVEIFVESEHPDLSIEQPLDGTISTAEMISVKGKADAFSTVIVNDTNSKLDENGHFSTRVLLNEGTNIIQVKAVNPAGLESNVERKVIRDTQKPELELSSPVDFSVLKKPYVTISGQVNEAANVELTRTAPVEGTSETLSLPLDSERKFSHTISLNQGTNEIYLKAQDQAGWESEILRRVIYEKSQKITEDTNPPAITDVFPLNGITLDTRKLEIKALLIDDIKLDIDTLVFSFDGEQYIFDPEYEEEEEYTEFDGKIFDFDSETGKFSYVPDFELADGEHNFTIDVMDEAENSAESVDIAFFVDTRPISVALSASKENDALEVSLTSNKPLREILEATVYPTFRVGLVGRASRSSHSFSEIGYSLNLDLKQEGTNDKPFLYSGTFYPTPAHQGFILSASVLPTSEIYGETSKANLQVTGFYTEAEFSGEELSLSIPNGPSASLSPLRPFAPSSPFDIILRSQDGSDLDRVAAQLKDAENRNLKVKRAALLVGINTPVYQLKSARELEEPIQIKLTLPELDKAPHKAMFYWNNRLRHWEPLDAEANTQTDYFTTTLRHDPSVEKAEPQKGILIDAFGSYALLVDEQPPAIEKISPEDGEDVSLDRFLVEIYFHDEGSGIAYANLEVDGEPVDFVLDKKEGRLTYPPKDLKPGLHELDVTVYDRASNSVSESSTFFTQEIFAFADEPICYPNPATHSVTISFMLTQSADEITLEIYNVVGEKVYYETQINGQKSEVVWDCKNQSGRPIASGVYVYLLKAKLGEREISHKGKIAVVK